MRSPLRPLCLVLALCLHQAVAQHCDDGYESFSSYNASRYKLPPFRLDWADALTACQSDGGGSHLVVINSDQEAEVVIELIRRIVGTSSAYPWVGITDMVTEGTWLTVQGDLVSASGYNKWAPGNPNGGTAHNCGAFYIDGFYRDGACSPVWHFICEKPNV